MEEIYELRKEIDKIDEAMIELLDKRVKLGCKIGELKVLRNLSVEDLGREMKVLERAGDYRDIFHRIISKTKREELSSMSSTDASHLSNKKMGIIGYGRMGKLLAEDFSMKMEVGLYDTKDITDDFHCYSSISELYRDCDLIMIATPTDTVPGIVEELADMAISGNEKAVFDISTFKDEVLGIYNKFPDSVKVASVHPMFGCGSKNLEGKRVVIVPVEGREADAEAVRSVFQPMGFEMLQIDAKDHDKVMKKVIGIPYLIGVSFLKMVSETDEAEMYGGNSFKYLSVFGRSVLHDRPEFIEDIFERSRETLLDFLDNSKPTCLDVGMLRHRYEGEIEDCYNLFNRMLDAAGPR